MIPCMFRRIPVAALFMALAFAAAAKDVVEPSTTEHVATLQDTRIKESSGIARSIRHADIFWTLNDSGGEPCIFAVDLHGHTRAKIRLPNAVNFDWEDICSGLDETNQPVLYIGDIGDNLKIRRAVQIYRILEPEVLPDGQQAPETISELPTVWHVRYPDAAHNAEGLLVHPQTRRLYVLTKDDDGKSTLFAFPAPIQENTHVTLEKAADITFPGHARIGKRKVDDRTATGADFSPDGRHLVASTYSSLYEWDLPEAVSLADALAKPPRRLVPELLRQLESVCYDADGKTLWLTSEHLPTPLIRVTRP